MSSKSKRTSSGGVSARPLSARETEVLRLLGQNESTSIATVAETIESNPMKRASLKQPVAIASTYLRFLINRGLATRKSRGIYAASANGRRWLAAR